MDKILEILSGIRPEFNFIESEDFINDGFLDSFDIVTLVNELEQNFSISIDGTDIIPENFKNLTSIKSMLKKKGVSL